MDVFFGFAHRRGGNRFCHSRDWAGAGTDDCVGDPGSAAYGFLFVVSLATILLDWQWVTVYEDRILVRCLLFEIRSIPVAKIKRCWVCPVWMSYIRGWHFYRNFLVIDTANTRKKHTIPDGFSRRKHRYIILPDTVENRYALRQLPEEVRRELQ